jgi:DNA-binding response OmpR family regulator
MESRILSVEDSLRYQNYFQELFDGKTDIVFALTIAEAEAAGIDFALVMVDACVPGDEPNTIDLVRKIRTSGFTGPIIGHSSEANYLSLLAEAGCSHISDKINAPKLALRLLGMSE